MYISKRLAYSVALSCSLGLTAAEDEFTLFLTDTSLIGKIESVNTDTDPDFVIDSYYQLLSAKILTSVSQHREELIGFVPKYRVAYTAADSAELSELMDKIGYHWAAIRTIHEKQFTPEVIRLLYQSYNQKFIEAGLTL